MSKRTTKAHIPSGCGLSLFAGVQLHVAFQLRWQSSRRSVCVDKGLGCLYGAFCMVVVQACTKWSECCQATPACDGWHGNATRFAGLVIT